LTRKVPKPTAILFLLRFCERWWLQSSVATVLGRVTGTCCNATGNVCRIVAYNASSVSVHTSSGSRDSSVSIVTRLRAGRPGFDFSHVQGFLLFTTTSRSAETHLASYSMDTGIDSWGGGSIWPHAFIQCRG
jgi:hypothetical protein